MTLILAIPAQDGVVIASDTQSTAGPIRQKVKKLTPLGKTCIWGGAGEVALIQRVAEQLSVVNFKPPIEEFRDQFSGIVREMVTVMIRQDFRTQFLPGDPDMLLDLHPASFVLAEYANKRARILHMLPHGISEWVDDNAFAIGNGSIFAYALVQRYERLIPNKIDVKRAALLAYRVIAETIEVGSYGVGAPIDIWQITKSGVENLGEDQVAALADAYRMMLETEIELLLGGRR